MSNDRPKSRDGIICNFAVGFFDLLGQSKALERLIDRPLGRGEDESIKNEFIAAVRDINRLRATMEGFLSAVAAEFNAEGSASSAQRTFSFVANWFSDCVAISHPLLSEDKKDDPVPLLLLFQFSALASLVLLGEGVPLRGGIQVGLAGEFWKREVYGPALLGAYSTESKLARWPRVAVAKPTYDYLQAIQWTGEGIPLALSISRGLVVMDDNGTPFIDFAGPIARVLFKMFGKPDDLAFKLQFQKCCNFSHSQLAQQRNDGNAELTERYDCLSKYLESRRPLWT